MIGELYDGEFDNFPREDGIIKDEELSQKARIKNMTDGVILKMDELTTDQIVSMLLGYVDQDIDTKLTRTLLTELHTRVSSLIRDEADKELKAASSKTDAVNHPDHYKIGDIECIDVMLATQGVDAVINFCICNSFKYIYRHVNKNGLEDIRKAKWYLDKALELVDSRKDKCGTSK